MKKSNTKVNGAKKQLNSFSMSIPTQQLNKIKGGAEMAEYMILL